MLGEGARRIRQWHVPATEFHHLCTKTLVRAIEGRRFHFNSPFITCMYFVTTVITLRRDEVSTLVRVAMTRSHDQFHLERPTVEAHLIRLDHHEEYR